MWVAPNLNIYTVHVELGIYVQDLQNLGPMYNGPVLEVTRDESSVLKHWWVLCTKALDPSWSTLRKKKKKKKELVMCYCQYIYTHIYIYMGPQCWPFMSYEATGAFIFLSRSKQSESFIFIYYMICFFVVKIYQYKISFLDRFDYYFFLR